MYRKEQCLSLLKDPKEGEMENDEGEEIEGVPKMKCHKVLCFPFPWIHVEIENIGFVLHR